MRRKVISPAYLAALWDGYRDANYDALHPDTEHEFQRAFFAGAAAVLRVVAHDDHKVLLEIASEVELFAKCMSMDELRNAEAEGHG